MRKYLHDYDHYLVKEQERIEKADIPSQNKQWMTDFHNFETVNGISTPRILRIASCLRLFSQKIPKPFDTITAKDVETFLVWMKTSDYAEESIATFRATLKVFYKWFNKGTYPECVAWIKSGSKSKYKRLPDDLLNQEEVKTLLQNTHTKRDKALISCIWESGARIGEIGGLQLKNVQFDEFGCQVMVDGKTGMRRIRLVSSAPYLLEWINEHPQNHDPNAPLWVTLTRKKTQQVVYAYIIKVIRGAAKRAGIKKPVNPHHFRHSRATYMAQFLTEAQMKEYFGWTQGSDMASRYVHLSGKQVDNAILELNGLKKPEKKEIILLQQNCPRCKTPNDVNSQYCKQCWLPLTPQAINSVEMTRQKDQEAMVAVMKLLEMAKTNPNIIQEAITQATQLKKEVV
ncbi:MAG: site-specific integrase [Candidatus Micrarchaeota archaeon]